MAGIAGATPPRTSRRLMKREALMGRLVEARRQRCIVVLGQAGSGKTSPLLAWRRELISLDFDVAWLTLSPENNQLQRFLRDLLDSVGNVDAAIVDEAGLLTEGVGADPDIEHWVIALVQGFASRQRELVLMLDDLHHVQNAGVFQAIQWLLDYAPERLHLALSSRSALPLSFERMRSRRLVTELDMRDLRFTPAESERFLREQLGSIDGSDALALHELTDGWVAGLQLFVIDLRNKEARDAKGEARYAPVRVRDAQAFAAYFEREVLVRVAPEDLDMLTRASVCNRFCVSLCVALLADAHAQAQPVPRVRARLGKLVEDNFFITQIGGAEREPWYRLHPLLRETLLARVAEWPEERQRALHSSACHWFSARGDVEDAVSHAVQAGEMAHAVAMVEASAHDLLSSGELGRLAELLRQLPQDAILRHFDLHVAQAYLAMYARDFEACDASLRQMEARRDALDARQRYDLLLLRCGLSVQRDQIDGVIASVPALRDIPADAKDLAWTSRANLLAWIHICQGEYDEAHHEFDDAQRRSGAQLSTLLGRCMSATGLVRQGKVREAERIARDVVRVAGRRGVGFGGVLCLAAGVLADIHYELNEVDAAQDLLEARVAVIERLALPDVVLRAMTTLSHCHWLAGQQDKAFAVLDRLEAYANRYGLDRVLAEATVLRLRRHLLRNEVERALGAMGRIEALARDSRHSGLAAERIDECLQRARSDMALYSRDFASAARLLEDGAAVQGRHLGQRAAELELQRAMTCEGIGDEPLAREHLVQALRIGHRLGLLRSMLDVSPEVPRLLQRMLPDGLEPVLAFYVGRLKEAGGRDASPAGGAPAPPAVAARPTAELSDREYEVLALLAQAMPNKKIARMLNVTLDTIKFHLKNIYGKLGVTARDEAVARLRDVEASREAARNDR